MNSAVRDDALRYCTIQYKLFRRASGCADHCGGKGPDLRVGPHSLCTCFRNPEPACAENWDDGHSPWHRRSSSTSNLKRDRLQCSRSSRR